MVKKNKRQRDIKTKLMAAICMLLVSSIMMVSSTYAWFTLSTAPEVTGITTAVGANGNLEMALLPADGSTANITTYVGSSIDTTGDATVSNLTWGNLVDLTSTTYGLDKITLFPSALNAATSDGDGNPLTLAEALLATPGYGADGRVTELLKNTVTSTYAANDGAFPGNDQYGVRAVGTASGMTDRQLAYRNARSTAGTNMAQAKNAAASSLNTKGNALANIAITHGTNADATHTQEDVTTLKAIVTDLLGDGTNTGILEYIENAYIQYILAYGASQEAVDAGMDDTEFKAFQGIVDSGKSLSEVVDELTGYGVIIPSEASAPINALATTKANVESAQTILNGLTGDAIAWGDLYPALKLLANPDTMTVNGITVDQIKTDEGINTLIQTIGGGLTVAMGTGGGVYADVADHCGDYNASITIKEISYGGLNVKDLNARMATASTVTPAYLTTLGAGVHTAGSPASAEGVAMPLTDMYGYIIDLAFRTNAAESSLLLQTEAVDRIYADNGEAAETMGNGSSMTFKATATDFTEDKVIALMESIRIVFFDNGKNVLATAMLDTANAESTAEGVVADIVMYELTAGTTTILTGSDAVITPLTQGVAQAVSVLVYLDGASITNADVAATAATSVTGTMNLQFASSATLVPMEYTALMDQTGESTAAATTTAAAAGTDATSGT